MSFQPNEQELFSRLACFEEQALGHSSIATTERYVNSTLVLDHAATDKWAEKLMRG